MVELSAVVVLDVVAAVVLCVVVEAAKIEVHDSKEDLDTIKDVKEVKLK